MILHGNYRGLPFGHSRMPGSLLSQKLPPQQRQRCLPLVLRAPVPNGLSITTDSRMGTQPDWSKALDPALRAQSQMHESRAPGGTFPWRAY